MIGSNDITRLVQALNNMNNVLKTLDGHMRDLTKAVEHNNRLMIEYGRIMEGFNPGGPNASPLVENEG